MAPKSPGSPLHVGTGPIFLLSRSHSRYELRSARLTIQRLLPRSTRSSAFNFLFLINRLTDFSHSYPKCCAASPSVKKSGSADGSKGSALLVFWYGLLGSDMFAHRFALSLLGKGAG